jgi:hypothetical protein
MSVLFDVKRIRLSRVLSWLIPALSFWLVLGFAIPYSLTQYFHYFVLSVFLVILALFYISFRLQGDWSVLAGFGLTMLLFALTVSYLWTSGFSDNFLISGLLPYKDAKNYYLGANLLLNGLPIRVAGQAMGRPLFPGFLSSLLMLTGQNLKISLAVLAQLAGIGVFISARQVRQAMGALPGALYITFMYLYFQIIGGYAMSESLGFFGGFFGFSLIWYAARHRKWFDFLLGLGILLLAVSARAGAFFIFPILALWVGWVLRGEKRFSLFPAILVLAIFTGGFFILNSLYPRALGVPEDSSFGNFAYAIYGQVRGGTGWHSAIDELGTRNPASVYQAAWEYFLANPPDFLKGILKAYSDFFFPIEGSIFPSGRYVLDLIFWYATLVIMLRGLYMLIFKHRSHLSLLLLGGFIGIFLSIPFLPPVDGGMRFYASTMPFYFVLIAIGASRRIDQDEEPATAKDELFYLRFGSVAVLALTVLLPPVTLRASTLPAQDEPFCTEEQRPFVIRVNPGSYIDLVTDKNTACGLAPEICHNDFVEHNTELYIDDFYQHLDALAASTQGGIRVIPTINLLDGYFQYFVAPDEFIVERAPGELYSGCAARIQTEGQRFFLVESISTADE